MSYNLILTKKIYVGGHYRHRKVNGIVALVSHGKVIKTNPKKLMYLEEHIATLSGYMATAIDERLTTYDEWSNNTSIDDKVLVETFNTAKTIIQKYNNGEEVISIISDEFSPQDMNPNEWDVDELNDYIDMLREFVEALIPIIEAKDFTDHEYHKY